MAPPPLADPRIGSIIDGKYHVAEKIGAGGMGTVYKAIHVSLGAPRALKVMRRELATDPALSARFRTEARLAEGLRHPSLVALYDFGQMPDGGWYLVTEFVEGATLAALLRRRDARFSPQDVAMLMGQVADGLAFAHKRGIVHRDISPDNIMLTAGEDDALAVKLLDFGIAKDTQRAPSAGATGLGWNMGKIGFSSPEQMGLLAPGESVDSRCDIFSLGAVAYLMLCGRLPWRRESLQDYTHDLLLRAHGDLVAEIRCHARGPWQDLFVMALARLRSERISTMALLKEGMARAAAASEAEGLGCASSFGADRLRASSRALPEDRALATRTLGQHTPEVGRRTPTATPLPVSPSSSAPVNSPPPIVPSALLARDMASWAGGMDESWPGGTRRLVLLDDDERLRAVLPDLLAGPDLQVAAGPWQGDAVSFAVDQAPDLILVDTGILGDEAATRLRRFHEHPRLVHVPLVLFSASDEWSLRAFARRMGATGYLPKDGLAGDMRSAVRRFLPPPRSPH